MISKLEKTDKIFISGHRGLVGSSVLSFFKKKGFKNLITRNKENLDLTNFKEVDKFYKNNNINTVIFCAGVVGGIKINSDTPVKFINDNSKMTLYNLEFAHKYGVKNFVFLGSACIYPKFIKRKIREEDLLKGILEPTNEAYSIAKILGLKSCNFYRKQYNRNYFSIMPTNLFGEKDNFNLNNSHVIPALIRKFFEANKKNEKYIRLWGTGASIRDMMYVDMLSSAIYFVLTNLNNKKLVKDIYNNGFINVGSGDGVSIKQLALKLKKISGFKGKIIFDLNKSIDGMPKRVLDTKKILKHGWSYRYDLDSSLRKVYRFYAKNYKKITRK